MKIKSKKSKQKKQEEMVGGHEQSNHDDAELTDNGQTAAHRAAATGDVEELEKIYSKGGMDSINIADVNKWQPIHEASRSGHLEALRFLIENGADLGAKTNNGATPLWWARRSLPHGHSVIMFLQDIGAPEEGDL